MPGSQFVRQVSKCDLSFRTRSVLCEGEEPLSLPNTFTGPGIQRAESLFHKCFRVGHGFSRDINAIKPAGFSP